MQLHDLAASVASCRSGTAWQSSKTAPQGFLLVCVQRPAVGIQPKRMAGNRVPVPIKRRKGASNRGGNAITIQHFFDPQD